MHSDESMETKVIPTLANIRRELITRGEYVKFSRAFSRASSSEEDRIAMTLKYLTDFNLLPFKTGDQSEPRKSVDVARRYWNAGNCLFMKDRKEAILMYTKSIASAPYPKSDEDDSEQLGLGFANRSAVYFVMGKYEACMKDIERALMFSYPEKLRAKLIERRRICCQKTGILNEQESMNHKHLPPFIPDSARLLITDTLTPFQREAERTYESSECFRPLPQKSFGQHEHIDCASDCLDIEYNSMMGRHIIANRDINPGAILFVERPLASVLLPDFSSTHCYGCLKRSEAMIPCRRCDSAMYCSSSCRDISWESSHNIECWLIPEFNQLDVAQTTVFLLPLRIFLTACSKNGGLAGLFRLVKELEKKNPDQNEKGFDENGQYLSLGYTQIHYLCHHRTKEPDFQLTWAVGVVCILNLLEKRSEIFSSKESRLSDEGEMSDLMLFAGGLLLKYIGITTTNCFSVTEFVVTTSSKQVDEVPFGDALYATLSLLNHSCNPNALNSFHHGDVHVVMAKQPIRSGEEIFISYGGSYSHREISERRHELDMNYHFECRCDACVNDWPTFNDLQPINCPIFICQNCRTPLPDRKLNGRTSLVTCTKCRTTHNLFELKTDTRNLQRRIIEIYNEIKCGSEEDFKSDLAEIVKEIDRTVQSPCQLVVASQQYLRYSLKATGNHVIQ